MEIGIGSAPNLQYYGSKAKRVRAVEPNAAFFDLAATQAQWEDTTLDVVQGVAEAMPFEDNSVDVVVGTMVLCSVTSVRKACEEVRRVLKPGGRYLFTEHTRAPEDWRLLNAAQTVMDPLQNALANGCHLRRDPRPMTLVEDLLLDTFTDCVRSPSHRSFKATRTSDSESPSSRVRGPQYRH